MIITIFFAAYSCSITDIFFSFPFMVVPHVGICTAHKKHVDKSEEDLLFSFMEIPFFIC